MTTGSFLGDCLVAWGGVGLFMLPLILIEGILARGRRKRLARFGG